jgi:hypothetical protein
LLANAIEAAKNLGRHLCVWRWKIGQCGRSYLDQPLFGRITNREVIIRQLTG